MMMNGFGGFGGGGMWFGPLVMIAVIALFVYLIFLLFRGFADRQHADRPHNGRSTRASPFDILRERYARGEIDDEEYEERKKKLQ